jgi:ABC-type multidrug transport system permease subunit
MSRYPVVTCGDRVPVQVVLFSLSPVFSIFSGFNITPADIPKPWKFMYWATPLHYALEVSGNRALIPHRNETWS